VVSGVFFGGVRSQVLEVWRDGRVDLVVTSDIREEYRRVGEELAQRVQRVSLAPFLAPLAVHARQLEPQELSERVVADPDDDAVIVEPLTCGGPGAIV
jgi:hypothetical protein